MIRKIHKTEAKSLKIIITLQFKAANTLFQAGDLEGAKTEYTKALGFFKRPLPADQIKIIDKKIADQAANEKRERGLREEQLKAERQKKNNWNVKIIIPRLSGQQMRFLRPGIMTMP